jgi:predicted nucleic acid-binding protein
MLLWPVLAEVHGLPPEIRVVFDTSVIIGDIRFLASKRRDPDARTALQELLASGIIVGYFPAESLDEVERKLDELAGRYQISRPTLASLWEDYRTLLRVCSIAALPLTDDERSFRDPTDVPFLRLQRLVGAHAVFSTDQDFLAGAKAVAPVVVRVELREFARAQTLYLSVVVGGTVTVSIPLVSVLRLIEAIVRLLAATPRWLPFALIVAAVVVLAHPRWRARAAVSLHAIAHAAPKIWEAVRPALETLVVQVAEADERSKELWRSITAAIPAVVESPLATGECRIATLSTTQRPGLTRRRRSYGSEKVRRATPRRRVAGKSPRRGSGKFAPSDPRRSGGTR